MDKRVVQGMILTSLVFVVMVISVFVIILVKVPEKHLVGLALSPEMPTEIASCTDTDGGQIFDTLGVVSLSKDVNNYTDSCNGDELTEYYCSNESSLGSLFVDCLAQGFDLCENGTCAFAQSVPVEGGTETPGNIGTGGEEPGGLDTILNGTNTTVNETNQTYENYTSLACVPPNCGTFPPICNDEDSTFNNGLDFETPSIITWTDTFGESFNDVDSCVSGQLKEWLCTDLSTNSGSVEQGAGITSSGNGLDVITGALTTEWGGAQPDPGQIPTFIYVPCVDLGYAYCSGGACVGCPTGEDCTGIPDTTCSDTDSSPDGIGDPTIRGEVTGTISGNDTCLNQTHLQEAYCIQSDPTHSIFGVWERNCYELEGFNACENGVCVSKTECGDGFLNQNPDSTEECDDGNSINTDACLNNCTIATCGDGFIQSGSSEQCDYADTTPGALPDDCTTVYGETCEYCSNSCLIAQKEPAEWCGDGTTQTGEGEECDEGQNNGGGTCTINCKLTTAISVCGDGVTEGDEECDGEDELQCYSGPIPTHTVGCKPDCSWESCEILGASCGDGQLDAGEDCDDGNLVNGDGCSSTCQSESGPTCGNEILEGNETCDIGFGNGEITLGCTVNGYAGSEICDRDSCQITQECTTAEYCGDGNTTGPEECDDGNTNNTDACKNDCTEPYCGDSEVNGNETCEIGDFVACQHQTMNLPGEAYCSNCQAFGECIVVEYCGNNETDAGEDCDDGNNVSCDGCSATCGIDSVCGDGVTECGEECDTGVNCNDDCTKKPVTTEPESPGPSGPGGDSPGPSGNDNANVPPGTEDPDETIEIENEHPDSPLETEEVGTQTAIILRESNSVSTNELLRERMGQVYDEPLTDESVDDLLLNAQEISDDFVGTREMGTKDGKTIIVTKLLHTGLFKLTSFVFYDEIPKTFADNADKITVTTGGRVEVVDPDPTYIVYFDTIQPNEEILITYEVDETITANVIDELSGEVYAKGIAKESDTEQPTDVDGDKKPFSWLIAAGIILIGVLIVLFLFMRRRGDKDFTDPSQP